MAQKGKENVTVTLPSRLLDILEEEAQKLGIPRSQHMRSIFWDHVLQEHESFILDQVYKKVRDRSS